MQPSTRTRRRRPDRGEHLGKPRGLLAPRVQAVGPEHFGIVAIDCAKARSSWLLADFYGRVLIPLTAVEHTRSGFDAAIAHLRRAIAEHDLRDTIVAVEQTGSYHRPVKRAFAAAGFDTRLVHPPISRPPPRTPPPTPARPPIMTPRPIGPAWRPGSSAPRSTASVCRRPRAIRPTPPCSSGPAIAATWSTRRPCSVARSSSTSRPTCPD